MGREIRAGDGEEGEHLIFGGTRVTRPSQGKVSTSPPNLSLTQLHAQASGSHS